MNPVQEDASLEFEIPSAVEGSPPSLIPARDISNAHKSTSDLDFMLLPQQRPGSPRSTLPDQEDGVIMTFKTRAEKMTRRHSMSRLFGPPSRSRSTENVMLMQQQQVTQKEPPSFDQVSQMRPGGLKRRNSLRSALLQQMSDEKLQTGGGSSRLLGRRNSVGALPPPPTSPLASAKASPPRMERRNSLRCVFQRQTTEETCENNNNNNNGSTRRMGRRNSNNGATSPTSPGQQQQRPRLARRGSSRGGGFLMRTTSFRKQDSLREWNPNATSTRALHDSQGSLNYTPEGNAKQPRAPRGGGGGLQRQASVADLIVDCNTTVSVSNTWASVRQLKDYQRRLGEQVIFRMIELEPATARKNMKLISMFSDRFTEICETLCSVIDMIVTLLGPDLDEATADLARLGQQCRDQGMNIQMLGASVSKAMAVLLGDDITADMVQAWKITFDALSRRLAIRVET
eukprot:scaffold91_cov173-Amphora_coffeaeformis.AAC.3